MEIEIRALIFDPDRKYPDRAVIRRIGPFSNVKVESITSATSDDAKVALEGRRRRRVAGYRNFWIYTVTIKPARLPQ